MNGFVKPRIVISKCIEFEFCRYNAQIIRSDIVSRMKPHVEFLPVCPEVEIGLGIPRDPIRIVEKQSKKYLVQPNTGRDVSEDMKRFAERFLSNQKDIDGFLLKSQSPSCGTRDVKIYPAVMHSAAIRREAGFFGEHVLKNFTFLAIEDDMRLHNPVIREHYFTKIFMFARFRKIKQVGLLRPLLRFHTENKFLLMAYSQKELRNLGNILANQDKQPLPGVFSEYEQHLHNAFFKAPRYTSQINVLNHVFGYVSQDLKETEKQFYAGLLQKFRGGQIPLSVIINLVRSWAIRFNQPYLLPQTFFEPYPDELFDTESIKASNVRDFWK
ncbi:MAG: DUF1722 domain-containing protein [Candidatus Thermoplasmatota archaeon]|nr:DUF1722 domain-containing protein [Candidatus Thermoplasmatota archaeon]